MISVEVTIRVKSIEWGDKFQTWAGSQEPVYPGVDGAVTYELRYHRTEAELAELKAKGVEVET